MLKIIISVISLIIGVIGVFGMFVLMPEAINEYSNYIDEVTERRCK